MLALGVDTFIEAGPGKVLSGLVQRCTRGHPTPSRVLNVEDAESLERDAGCPDGRRPERASEGHEAVAGGQVDGLGAALGAELGQDRRDVELDGVVADGEALGDGLVGQALGDEVEYLALPLGQILAEASPVGASGRQSRPTLPTSPGSRATRPAATARIAAPSSAAPAAGVR